MDIIRRGEEARDSLIIHIIKWKAIKRDVEAQKVLSKWISMNNPLDMLLDETEMTTNHE